MTTFKRYPRGVVLLSPIQARFVVQKIKKSLCRVLTTLLIVNCYDGAIKEIKVDSAILLPILTKGFRFSLAILCPFHLYNFGSRHFLEFGLR